MLLLVVPATASAGFTNPITITSSGADPFGYPSDIGFDQAGATTVETVSGGQVLVYTRPPGGAFGGGPIGSGSKASMAVSANGTAVTVWKESATSVKVAYRASSGGSFAAAASFPGAAVGNVAAGIDASGNAVVVWKDGGIHYALSTGATFGAAQDVTGLGATPGFEGRGSDPQRDHGPRAFRDNAGNVMLAFRNGNNATVAHRAPSGTWDSAILASASIDLQADAAPTSQRLIVGYTLSGTFRAFEGSTASTSGTLKVDQPASSQIFSVGVRRGGSEDVAMWRDNADTLQSASSLDGFTQATVDPGPVGAGVFAAVTSGSDLIAYYTASPGFQRASRSPGAGWVKNGYTVSNYGTAAGGVGYNGDALGLFVDFPDDTAITGFPYCEAAASGPNCGSGPPGGQRPTGPSVSCNRGPAPTDPGSCTVQVGDGGPAPFVTPTGSVKFTAGRGTFQSDTCTLQKSSTSDQTAFCTVTYRPPPEGIPAGQRFPVTASYLGDAQHDPSSGTAGGTGNGGDKRPTGTQVRCDYFVATDSDTCTATVGDGGGPPKSTPQGSVAFASEAGGVFVGGTSCVLRATSGALAVASCSVEFRPRAGGGFPQIKATYSGDATHAASSGHTEFIIAAVPKSGPQKCNAKARGSSSAYHARTSWGVHANAAQNRSAFQREQFHCYAVLAALSGGSLAFTGFLLETIGPYVVSGLANPEAIPIVVIGGKAGEGAGAYLTVTAAALEALSNDPPDPHFRTIAVPHARHIALLKRKGSLSRRLAPKVNAVVVLEGQLIAVSRALEVSRDRAGGAHRARNRVWERLQMLAVSRYAGREAALLRTFASRSRQLAAALRAPLAKVRISTAKATSFIKSVARTGLPHKFVATLKRFGATDRDVRAVAQTILVTSPRRLVRSITGLFGDPAVLASYRRTASVLAAYAKRTRKNPRASQN